MNPYEADKIIKGLNREIRGKRHKTKWEFSLRSRSFRGAYICLEGYKMRKYLNKMRWEG
jgi:hypothetical protein